MLKTNRFNLAVSVYSDKGKRIPCFAVICAQQSTHARLNGIYLLIKMSLQQLLGRILTGCYWFCILIWISTYIANLAAFFTVKNAEYPINSLADLAKSTYEVGVLDSSSVYEAFKESPGLTNTKGPSFALQANDPHTNDFTLAILRLQENHFIDAIRRKWWETSNSCSEEEKPSMKVTSTSFNTHCMSLKQVNVFA